MSESLDPSDVPEVRLKDLRAGLPPVHVLGRVVTLAKREVTGKRDGLRRTVLSGLLTDGTATVRFTWWDPPAEGVDPGTVLRAVNAQVREFRERPELSFGWSTRIQPASEVELPSVEAVEWPLQQVAALQPHDGGFRLEVRVLDVTARTVTVGEERRSIHSGRMADSSGSISFTAWVDFRLQPGETVRIMGGYIRRFRSELELTLDERSHVERIETGVVSAAPPRAEVVRLGAVTGRGGAPDVLVEGIVVDIGSPSGVVLRCPTCRRILREGTCPDHGHVDGTPDVRVRMAVDDGTGVATVNLPRNLSEQVTGRSLEQLLDRLRTEPDPGLIERDLRRDLLGQRVRVRGTARVDEFGLSMFAVSCERTTGPLGGSLDSLARRLGGVR